MPDGIHVIGTSRTGVTPELEIMRADHIWRRMDELLRVAGFQRWTYSAAPVCPTPATESLRVTTYPGGHVRRCVEQRLLPFCPGLSFAFRCPHPTPFKVVRDVTPMTRQFSALLRLNREFSVTRGMVIPLRSVFGFTGVLAISFEGTDGSLRDTWQERREALLPQIVQQHEDTLARHARLFTRDALPALSLRHREVVSLIAAKLIF